MYQKSLQLIVLRPGIRPGQAQMQMPDHGEKHDNERPQLTYENFYMPNTLQ